MEFTIEEVIELDDNKVEVRARLEDGRLACVSTSKGSATSYEAAVKDYIAEAFPPEPAPAEGASSEE